MCSVNIHVNTKMQYIALSQDKLLERLNIDAHALSIDA